MDDKDIDFLEIEGQNKLAAEISYLLEGEVIGKKDAANNSN
jgi:hypothetical protein